MKYLAFKKTNWQFYLNEWSNCMSFYTRNAILQIKFSHFQLNYYLNFIYLQKKTDSFLFKLNPTQIK